MCGIFGQATNNPNKINQSNIKILGMANETRGRNSCGITYDGEIYLGLDKDKLFTDFAKGKTFKAKKYPVMFGHTRQASVGVINHHNAHPFGFGDHNEGYEFIAVHNGTLLNHDELAKKYEIDTFPSYLNDNNIKSYRTKIDSEILLEIIHKTNSLKVLSEYNGRAALVWTDTKNPNTIYLYSGKSVPSEGDGPNLAVEERPLNVWVENKNSFYFSSLPESLYIIGGDANNVFQIDYNTVYAVKNGDFKHASKILISRKKCYHERKTVYGSTTHTTTNSSVGNSFRNPNACGYDLNRKRTIDTSAVADYSFQKIHILDDKSILQGKTKDGTYIQSFRYYRNGHLLNGIWMYIPEYGFYPVAQTETQMHDFINRHMGEKFDTVTGEFDVFKKMKVGEGIIAFSTVPEGLEMCKYFVEGVRLEDLIDYKVMVNHKAQGLRDFFDPMKMSHMATDPVVSLCRGALDAQGIYFNGVLFTGIYEGLDYDKKYYCRHGNLWKTKSLVETDEPLVIQLSYEKKPDPTFSAKTLDATIHTLATMESDYIREQVQTKIDFDLKKKSDLETEVNEVDETYFDNENKEVVTKAQIAEFLSESIVESFETMGNEIESLEIDLERFPDHEYTKAVKSTVIDIKLLLSEYTRKLKN